MNSQKNSAKALLIVLSCVSIGSVVGSFGSPLQQVEVWEQPEIGQFSQVYSKKFIINQSDSQKPYGLDRNKAIKIMTIYNDSKLQKFLLVATGILSGLLALYIGEEIIPKLELQLETQKINVEAQKQFMLNQIKHKWAMASQSQKLQFREELKELAALFGEDSLEADEVNETDKFINASYMLAEGHDIDTVVMQTWQLDKNSPEFNKLKEKFQQWLNEEK